MDNGFLVKTTEVYRLETVEQVQRFHEELKNDPSFQLTSFGYKDKVKKSKGMIEDEWKLVTVVKSFNEEADPNSKIDVTYTKRGFEEHE